MGFGCRLGSKEALTTAWAALQSMHELHAQVFGHRANRGGLMSFNPYWEHLGVGNLGEGEGVGRAVLLEGQGGKAEHARPGGRRRRRRTASYGGGSLANRGLRSDRIPRAA